MLDGLAPALAFGFIAGVMPGPLQTFLLLQSLRRGLGGLWVVPAPLVSDGPIIVVCLLILSQAGEGLLRGLAATGGLFLIYLAWESWRGLRRDAGDDEQVLSLATRDGWALLARAATINFLGPAPWVFWGTVMGPLLVGQWRQSAGRGLAFLAVFYGTFMTIMVVELLLFSSARRLGPRIARAGTWLGIVLLAVFAVLLLLYGAGVTERHGL